MLVIMVMLFCTEYAFWSVIWLSKRHLLPTNKGSPQSADVDFFSQFAQCQPSCLEECDNEDGDLKNQPSTR